MNHNYQEDIERERRMRLRDEECQKKNINILTSQYEEQKMQFQANNRNSIEKIPQKLSIQKNFDEQKLAEIVMNEILQSEKLNNQAQQSYQQRQQQDFQENLGNNFLQNNQNIELKSDYNQNNQFLIQNNSEQLKNPQFNLNDQNQFNFHQKNNNVLKNLVSNYNYQYNDNLKNIDNGGVQNKQLINFFDKFSDNNFNKNIDQKKLIKKNYAEELQQQILDKETKKQKQKSPEKEQHYTEFQNQFNISNKNEQQDEKQRKLLYADELQKQIIEKETKKLKQKTPEKEYTQSSFQVQSNKQNKNQQMDEKQRKQQYAQELKAQMEEKERLKKLEREKQKQQDQKEIQYHNVQMQKKIKNSQQNPNFSEGKMQHSNIYQLSQQIKNFVEPEPKYLDPPDLQNNQKNLNQFNFPQLEISNKQQLPLYPPQNNYISNSSQNSYNSNFSQNNFKPSSQQQNYIVPQQLHNYIPHTDQNDYMSPTSQINQNNPNYNLYQAFLPQNYQFYPQNFSQQFNPYVMQQMQPQNQAFLMHQRMVYQHQQNQSFFHSYTQEMQKIEQQNMALQAQIQEQLQQFENKKINTQQLQEFQKQIRDLQLQKQQFENELRTIKQSMSSNQSNNYVNPSYAQSKLISNMRNFQDYQSYIKQSFIKNSFCESNIQEEKALDCHQEFIQDESIQMHMKESFAKDLNIFKKIHSSAFTQDIQQTNQIIEDNSELSETDFSVNPSLQDNFIRKFKPLHQQNTVYDPIPLQEPIGANESNVLSETQQSLFPQFLTEQYQKNQFQNTQEAKERKWREMLEIPLHTHEPQEEDPYIPLDLEQHLIQTNDYSYLQNKNQQFQESEVFKEQTQEDFPRSQKQLKNLLEMTDIQQQQLQDINRLIKLQISDKDEKSSQNIEEKKFKKPRTIDVFKNLEKSPQKEKDTKYIQNTSYKDRSSEIISRLDNFLGELELNK